MPSSDTQIGEPTPIKKDYSEIIQSNVEFDKKFIEDSGVPIKIVYYCHDCEKLISPKRIGKKFKFKCEQCKGKNVSFGSEKSIANYYKLNESGLKKKE